MAARQQAAVVIDAPYSTLVGTPEQIVKFLGAMRVSAAVISMAYSNIVLLDAPLTDQRVRMALATTPGAARKA